MGDTHSPTPPVRFVSVSKGALWAEEKIPDGSLAKQYGLESKSVGNFMYGKCEEPDPTEPRVHEGSVQGNY